MSGKDVIGLTSDALKSYIDSHAEKDYLLIDVRQPQEYSDAHIPGAKLIPLPTIESNLKTLPDDRDMVFYCRSGGRSKVAATFAIENQATQKTVYHLEGGILSWSDRSRPGFPRIKILTEAADASELLCAAMDLEKGAWRLYQHIVKQYPQAAFARTVAGLAEAEAVHARLCYDYWATLQPEPPEPFENVFDGLSGDIIEGGQDIADVMASFQTLGTVACIEVIELALDMETAAYDLYRNVAVDMIDTRSNDFLMTIAQAEKDHMRHLADALQNCDSIET